jgi:4-hydroxybutyrate dehydrogenase
MQLFKLKTRLSRFDSFAAFAAEFQLGPRDLVITHAFIHAPFMKDLNLGCRFLMQEQYGAGEPTDVMMNAMLKDAQAAPYDRVIAIGGGTVIDIAKLFVLEGLQDVVTAFERAMPLVKAKQLVIVPTTCGTGSEVTNISIAEITSKQTKMGLADDAITADEAVIIPELLKGLPFKFYVYSAIDAFIHAVESYVAPRSNPYTKIYCKAAVELILDVFTQIAAKGEAYRFERLEDMLVASNFAGIAFGNTGVGAVHALSYPLGGTYHVPHGEANYQFFTAVFQAYQEKQPQGGIQELNSLLASRLGCKETEVYEKIEALFGQLLSKNKLSSYGMKAEEIETFADSVLQKQGRLLANNYVELTRNEIRDIYKKLF